MGIERVLILGDSGFIGKTVRQRLESCLPTGAVEGRSMPAVDLSKTNHMDRLADLFTKQTAVVMCAGVKRQLGDTLDIFFQNVQMVVNVCRLLERRPVGRFLYFSSAAVYGEDVHNTRINEGTPVCPKTYYGIAKFASEGLLTKTFASLGKERLLLLRPPLVYGPGDGGAFYGPSGFLKAVLNKEMITLWGDGMELREFVYVEDVAKIVEGLIFGSAFGVLNVVSGKPATFVQALDIISRLQGGPPKYCSKPRSKEKVDNVFLAGKLAEVFPAFEFASLEEGMRETWKALLAEGRVAR